MAEPVYRQIADDLRGRIEAGELSPGAQLPTEFELRDQYNASRNTVRDAVRALVSRGLVVTRPGQGSFVVDRIMPFAITMSTDGVTGLGGGEGVAYMAEARAQLRYPTATVPSVEIKTATGSIARQLGLDEGEQVVARHQKLRMDGKPWSMQTSFYPHKFVELGAQRLVEAKNIEPGTVHYVASVLGFTQVGYQDMVVARPPNDGEIDYFRLLSGGGVTVIETTRTAYETSGRPIRCTITVWPADRNILLYNIGTVPVAVTSPAVADESKEREGT